VPAPDCGFCGGWAARCRRRWCAGRHGRAALPGWAGEVRAVGGAVPAPPLMCWRRRPARRGRGGCCCGHPVATVAAQRHSPFVQQSPQRRTAVCAAAVLDAEPARVGRLAGRGHRPAAARTCRTFGCIHQLTVGVADGERDPSREVSPSTCADAVLRSPSRSAPPTPPPAWKAESPRTLVAPVGAWQGWSPFWMMSLAVSRGSLGPLLPMAPVPGDGGQQDGPLRRGDAPQVEVAVVAADRQQGTVGAEGLRLHQGVRGAERRGEPDRPVGFVHVYTAQVVFVQTPSGSPSDCDQSRSDCWRTARRSPRRYR
jgi:hypothetical protein